MDRQSLKTPAPTNWIALPADMVRDRQVVVFPVAGTCMQPEVMDGDNVVVDIGNRSPRPGQLVAVRFPDGGLRLKRFEVQDGRPTLMDNQGREYPFDGAVIQGVAISSVRVLDAPGLARAARAALELLEVNHG